MLGLYAEITPGIALVADLPIHNYWVFGYLQHPVPCSFVVRWGCEVVRLWGCEVVRRREGCCKFYIPITAVKARNLGAGGEGTEGGQWSQAWKRGSHREWRCQVGRAMTGFFFALIFFSIHLSTVMRTITACNQSNMALHLNWIETVKVILTKLVIWSKQEGVENGRR